MRKDECIEYDRTLPRNGAGRVFLAQLGLYSYVAKFWSYFTLIIVAHGVTTRSEHSKTDFPEFNWPWTTDYQSTEPVWPDYNF